VGQEILKQQETTDNGRSTPKTKYVVTRLDGKVRLKARSSLGNLLCFDGGRRGSKLIVVRKTDEGEGIVEPPSWGN